MDVAIVGQSPTTHDQVPMDWEIWGMPWDEGFWVHCDRLFEMHELSLIEKHPEVRPKGYIDRLKSIEVPLYMQEAYFPNVTKYPIDGYLNSSIAYMLALAIHEDADKIGLWGVDMRADEEYFYQRPNIEYLLGLAVGQDIEIVIPDESPILKFNGNINYGTHLQNYKGRYGVSGRQHI